MIDITKLTKSDREELFYKIMKMDNISITKLVQMKEQHLNESVHRQSALVEQLGHRTALVIFGTKKTREEMRPRLAETLLELDCFTDPFREELKKRTPTLIRY